MERIGEVHETANGFEWRIGNFFHLSEDERYFSPSFFSNGTSWSLGIDPNGDTGNHSVGYIDLCLVKKPGDFPISIEFLLALKTVNGETVLERHCIEDFGEGCERYVSHRIITRSELVKRKSELVPSDVLTVVCIMKNLQSTSASNVSEAVCSYCKDTFEAAIISSHEKVCLDKPTKCQECSSVILLKNSYDHNCQISAKGDNKTVKCFCCKEDLGSDFISMHKRCLGKPVCPDFSDVVHLGNSLCTHECQNERTEGIKKLLSDLKGIMLNDALSDIIVKVKGEEFRLHKNILAARCPFFDSMFKNEAREITSDPFIIDECEPSHFRSLIHYLYTGTIDDLCPENVCEIYEVALAYKVEQMKLECLQFMMNTFSVENFFNYTALSLTHDEKEVFQKATELWSCKQKEITDNVKWKSFLEKYPVQVNDLCKNVIK